MGKKTPVTHRTISPVAKWEALYDRELPSIHNLFFNHISLKYFEILNVKLDSQL